MLKKFTLNQVIEEIIIHCSVNDRLNLRESFQRQTEFNTNYEEFSRC